MERPTVQDFYNERFFADPVPPKAGREHVLKGAGFVGDVTNATWMTCRPILRPVLPSGNGAPHAGASGPTRYLFAAFEAPKWREAASEHGLFVANP